MANVQLKAADGITNLYSESYSLGTTESIQILPEFNNEINFKNLNNADTLSIGYRDGGEGYTPPSKYMIKAGHETFADVQCNSLVANEGVRAPHIACQTDSSYSNHTVIGDDWTAIAGIEPTIAYAGYCFVRTYFSVFTRPNTSVALKIVVSGSTSSADTISHSIFQSDGSFIDNKSSGDLTIPYSHLSIVNLNKGWTAIYVYLKKFGDYASCSKAAIQYML